MTDSLSTFSVQDALVRIDGSGSVTGIEHRTRPGLGYLSLGLPEDSGAPLVRTGVTVDADEVEVVLADDSALTVIIRHNFVGGWRFRCILVNSGPVSRRLRLSVPLSMGAGVVAWGVAEGAEAELFVQPRDGRGPLLVGRLRQGCVGRITEAGLELPELVLDAGARYVLTWEWDWLPRPSTYARNRPSILPATTTLTRGSPITVRADPDTAIVAPAGVFVERVGDTYELTAAGPLAAEVELRSARGLRILHLRWTPTAKELLRQSALDVLAARRGPVGVAVLPGLEAAVVVQHAVAAELLDAPDEAGDALDLFTARLDQNGAEPVLSAHYLCGEYERTYDPELLQPASRQVLRVDGAEPGLGAVATRICVARVAAGISPQPVMDHLLALAAGSRPADTATDDVERLAATAELLAITRAAGSLPKGEKLPPGDPLLALVLGLATELGSGLPGRAVLPLPVAVLGHLLTVFAMLPDALAGPTRRAWGMSAADLSERLAPTLIAQLAGAEVGRGHVWLTLLAGTG